MLGLKTTVTPANKHPMLYAYNYGILFGLCGSSILLETCFKKFTLKRPSDTLGVQ